MFTTGIFDLGDVLIGAEANRERRFAKFWGITPERAKECLGLYPNHRIYLGRMTENQYWHRVTKNSGLPCDLENLKAEMRGLFQEVPGTRSIIESLRARGIQLGLLSVHGREWIRYCEDVHRYHRHFDAVHYSYERKMTKTNPASFKMILDDLRADPHECFFVDNTPGFVEIARSLGIHGIVFRDADQLQSELRLIGL